MRAPTEIDAVLSSHYSGKASCQRQWVEEWAFQREGYRRNNLSVRAYTKGHDLVSIRRMFLSSLECRCDVGAVAAKLRPWAVVNCWKLSFALSLILIATLQMSHYLPMCIRGNWLKEKGTQESCEKDEVRIQIWPIPSSVELTVSSLFLYAPGKCKAMQAPGHKICYLHASISLLRTSVLNVGAWGSSEGIHPGRVIVHHLPV